jgi:hypothetical protein
VKHAPISFVQRDEKVTAGRGQKTLYFTAFIYPVAIPAATLRFWRAWLNWGARVLPLDVNYSLSRR